MPKPEASAARDHRSALLRLYEALDYEAACSPEDKPVARLLLNIAMREEREARDAWRRTLVARATTR